VTLFTTADWREISPVPTKRLIARVPFLRDRLFLTDVLAPGTMRLDRHPDFVAYLTKLPRTEVGLHGLHHIHRGPTVLIEFQDESAGDCEKILTRAQQIFDAAGLPAPLGMTPPGWNAPAALLEAMARVGMSYIASARDIVTPLRRTRARR
jgi:predicted deacetylase